MRSALKDPRPTSSHTLTSFFTSSSSSSSSYSSTSTSYSSSMIHFFFIPVLLPFSSLKFYISLFVQRAVDDGINSVRVLCNDQRLLPGAGAVELELCKRYVRTHVVLRNNIGYR